LGIAWKIYVVKLTPKTIDVKKAAESLSQQVLSDNAKMISTTNTTAKQEAEITGNVSVNVISALVHSQKYRLLVDGMYNPKRINDFINNNINRFLPANDIIIAQRAVDLDNDGIKEVGLMYEKNVNPDKYLMFAVLKWKDGQFVKDIDEPLRKNDFTKSNNQIASGDIITGDNQEFCFIQRDISGNIGSKIQIVKLLPTGFYDFITLDAYSDIQVKDVDSDGKSELQMTKLNEDGSLGYEIQKWNGQEFVKIQG
jgi:hypothetical protein